MPIYIYSCQHGTKELLLSKPSKQTCEHGCDMQRNYSSERAGLPPFKAYETEALTNGRVRIDSRQDEKAWEKKTGFIRIS